MITACLLRFWNISEIPFTHDEFSSLLRSDCETLLEVIKQGVITDTHPPLSQIIYFFMMQLGGRNEVWIKLPYLIMGVMSVWLVYRLGKRWFSETTGLLAASFFAVLQECVMHSQIARPYALGNFLCLWTALLLTTVCLSEKKPPIAKLLLTGLVLSLCALTHHFSMLLAFLLFIGFVCITWRTKWKALLVIGITAVILYSPNIFILKYQLAQRGIGTVLAKPRIDFLADYFYYIFHFSPFVSLLFCVLLLMVLFRFNQKSDWKLASFSFALFILTYAVGHLYSCYVAPVMHFRVLYFALPFFFLFLFSFAKEYSAKWKLIMVTAILLVGSSSLIFERFHYRIFYSSGYAGVWNDAVSANHYNSSQTNLLAFTPYMMEFQKEKSKEQLEVINPDSSWTMKDFVRLIDHTPSEEFNMGFTMQYYKPPIEVLGMLLKKYESISIHHNYFNSWFYHFSNKEKRSYSSHYLNENDCIYAISDSLKQTDVAGKPLVEMGRADEYGYKCTFKMPHTKVEYHDWIIAHAEIECNDSSSPSLVLELVENGKTILWQSAQVNDFSLEGRKKTDVYVALYSIDVLQKNKPYDVTAYIWNKGDSLKIHALDYYIIDGNPMMYSLVEPVNKADIKKLPQR